MKDKIAKNWWLLLIAGIAYVILGIIVWQYPGATVLAATIYIAISLLITGFSLIAMAISQRKGMKNWGWFLVSGIVDILLGSILLINPIASAVSLTLIIGFWFIFRGALEFVNAFDLKQKGVKGWWMNLIGGILIAVFGWVIIGKPLAGTVAIISLISIALWINGIVMAVCAFNIKGLKGQDADLSVETS